MKLRSLLCLALVLVSPAAFADPAPAPLASSLEGEAKLAYDQATLLFQDHDYAGASTKYHAALNASHDPRLLWNIAACEKELRHYVRASALVDQFLREAGASVPPERVEQAKATQDALKQLFDAVRFDVQPSGARVLVDGEEIGRAPLPGVVLFDIGKHTLRVEQDGFLPYESSFEVGVTRSLALEVTLRPVPPPVPVEAPKPANPTLTVTPSEADEIVSVDGAVVGGGKWEGVLSPGPHHVDVTGKGRRPRAIDLTLAAGEHRVLEVSLVPETHAAVWPWIVGGAALVVAGGITGTYFALHKTLTNYEMISPPPGAAGNVNLNGWSR